MNEEFEDKLALLSEMSRNSSLQEIADNAYELLGNPIFIQDRAHTTLAYTKVVEIPDEDWQHSIVQSELTFNNSRQSKEVKTIHRESIENMLPVLVSDQERRHQSLVKTLQSNGHFYGVVVMAGVLKPIAPIDIRLLDLLSVYVMAHLERDRNLTLSDEKAVGSFIIKLLDGITFTSEQIRSRLNILGWKPLKYLYIMVIRPDEGFQDVEGYEALLTHLAEIPYCRAFVYGEEIVFICSKNQPVSGWSQEEPQICDMIAKLSMQAGASNAFQDLANIRTYYTEAMTALRLGETLQKQNTIHPYHNYVLYYLLEKMPESIILRSLCNEKILSLERSDKSEGDELLMTLQVYLEFSRSITKAADILFVHKNTVQYRINKCMKLMNTDFEDGNEIFSYILSLRILEYEKKVRRVNQTRVEDSAY